MCTLGRFNSKGSRLASLAFELHHFFEVSMALFAHLELGTQLDNYTRLELYFVFCINNHMRPALQNHIPIWLLDGDIVSGLYGVAKFVGISIICRVLDISVGTAPLVDLPKTPCS